MGVQVCVWVCRYVYVGVGGMGMQVCVDVCRSVLVCVGCTGGQRWRSEVVRGGGAISLVLSVNRLGKQSDHVNQFMLVWFVNSYMCTSSHSNHVTTIHIASS